MSLCPTHGATQTSPNRCPFCEIQAAIKLHADLIQQLMENHRKPKPAKTAEPSKVRKRAG